jgi:acyl carrier protein
MAVDQTRLEHFKKLQKICSEVIGVEEHEVMPSSNFFDDLGVSMSELAEIFTRTAEIFKMSIQKQDIQTINTVGELLEYIEEQL